MTHTIARKFAMTLVLGAGTCVWAQGPAEPRMLQGPDGGGPGFGLHRPPLEDALGPRGAHIHWWNDPALIEKLKLTDDQRKAMDAILLEHREKLIDLHAAVDKAELAMEPLMQDEHPNEAQILAQIDKVAQARAELEKANARFLLALRSKLSPDQWKLLREARAERLQRRWEGHGPGGGPGRQPGPPPPQGGPGSGPMGMLEPMEPPVPPPAF